MDAEAIKALAAKTGTGYVNRHFPGQWTVAFSETKLQVFAQELLNSAELDLLAAQVVLQAVRPYVSGQYMLGLDAPRVVAMIDAVLKRL